MKKALKKVLSVAMAAAMAVGLMTMSASTAFAEESDYSLTVKINFTKPAEWSKVSAKVAEGTDWAVIDGYDGESDAAALKGEGDVYSVTVTTKQQWGLHFIFNNGGWGNGQTANLDLSYDFAAGSYEYNLTNDDIEALDAIEAVTPDDLAKFVAKGDVTPADPATTADPGENTEITPNTNAPETEIAPTQAATVNDEETPAEDKADNANDKKDETPKTGDNALIFVAVGLALVAGTSAVVIKKRKAA